MLVLKTLFLIVLIGYLFCASKLWPEFAEWDHMQSLPTGARIFWYIMGPVLAMILFVMSKVRPDLLADLMADMDRQKREHKND